MSFFEKAKKSMEGTRQDGCEKSELSEKRIIPTSLHDAGIDIQKMSLSEFGNAGISLKIWSEVLQDHVYFISSEDAITRNQLDAVAYSATELTKTLSMTPQEVQAAHSVKTIFHKAKIVEHRRVEA